MGLDDLVNQAKDMLGQGGKDASGGAGAAGMVDKAKELLTDERIDQVAGAIKERTPDNVDSVVDQVAEKAKQFND